MLNGLFEQDIPYLSDVSIFGFPVAYPYIEAELQYRRSAPPEEPRPLEDGDVIQLRSKKVSVGDLARVFAEDNAKLIAKEKQRKKELDEIYAEFQ